MEIITSINNTLIKALKKQKEKNRFLLFLDTPKLVKEALEAKLVPNAILLQEGKSFEFLEDRETICVSKAVIESLSSVKTPAGIIGIFEYNRKTIEKPKTDFLVLDQIQDAGNIGTLIRSALGADFKYVYMLDCCSVTNDKVVRSSMSSLFKLNIFETSKEEFLKEQKSWGLPLIIADMDGENVFNYTPQGNVGIVLGNEGNGVSKELRGEASQKISIPMKNGLESLNVGVAGSIIMFQVSSVK